MYTTSALPVTNSKSFSRARSANLTFHASMGSRKTALPHGLTHKTLARTNLKSLSRCAGRTSKGRASAVTGCQKRPPSRAIGVYSKPRLPMMQIPARFRDSRYLESLPPWRSPVNIHLSDESSYPSSEHFSNLPGVLRSRQH